MSQNAINFHCLPELIKAIDSLRDQLNSQKEAVHKYEGKIKRREAELKEKTQELRKIMAEAANAKLQVDKVVAERNGLKSKNQALEAMEAKYKVHHIVFNLLY